MTTDYSRLEESRATPAATVLHTHTHRCHYLLHNIHGKMILADEEQ